MNRILQYLPELSNSEFDIVQRATGHLSDDEFQLYSNIYRVRRKDPQNVLLMGIIGLFLLPGIQRFYVDQIGMGVLFLFTLGLCFIGSIVDLVNYRTLADEYNTKVANEIGMMVKR